MGGGIVGLAVAREALIRQPGLSVLLLEAEDLLAGHQSSHNSGVIHAGIYYKPGSLKAKLCREGSQLLYETCAELGVPTDRIGKLIVATSADELPALDRLEQRAQANGILVDRLEPAGLRELEPYAGGIAALHSPDTGIVDYGLLCKELAGDLRARGGVVVTGCAAERISNSADGAIVHHRQGETRAGAVIACAGLQSDRLAEASGESADPRIVPFRGAYFELRRPELVRGLIYPVPDPSLPFLGVHLTRRIGGDVVVGPTAIPALARGNYRPAAVNLADAASTLAWPGSYRMAWRWRKHARRELGWALSARSYAKEAKRLVPQLKPDDLEPSFAGLRAQAVDRSGELADDFVFSGHGRVLQLRNAPSPAATASLAIARYCCDRLGAIPAGEPSTSPAA
uniref:Unannotated protein n=1 Tax=freshwater metagenome TaxID=449393 RepID=A0A6J5ZZ15_9ZZZZ